MLSQRARYALKALLALAEGHPGSPQTISDIAQRQGMPHKFLALILLDLKRFGLVQSRRGREGGYLLAKPPSKISFGQVIRLIEGPIALLPCVSKTRYRRCTDCPNERRCGIHTLLMEVRESTSSILDGQTLQDAIGTGTKSAKARIPRAGSARRSA